MLFKRKKSAPDAKQVAVSAKLDQRLTSDFILGAIEDGVVMVGIDNVIHLFNPAAAQIAGWPATEAVGLDYHSVLQLVDEHGEAYSRQNHPIGRVLASGQAIRDSKAFLQTRGSKLIPISIIVSPVNQAPNMPPQNVVGVFRDITAEREEEARRSEFVSTASHEMRTPIAAIEGYLSLALNPKISSIDNRAKNYLDKAYASIRHLGQLFQDLLTSSRAEDGRLASYPTVVEIGEIVAGVADGAKFNAQKKGLQIRFLVSGSNEVRGGKVIRPLFFVSVDPDRMREVFQNLVDNAIKYTEQGSITLVITGNDSVVQIQVADTGAGIPEEDIPHLFQKFYRVDSSMTRTVGGTGLGLYICRRLVELYQGRIWVESQLGKGSTFFINLPRLSPQKALELQRTQSSLVKPEQRPL
ncbi:hypothetical protein A3F65_01345 [Candidatus Saccharibacteria bacterium RIFCSPHIGHO2_12_FULL_47_16b]|nr:MAG: hypothetical protein A3F65_01345 [Candidatus Saccharibacteria bacterium RIFCSPHIGHO2_12_FULL_47_16b]